MIYNVKKQTNFVYIIHFRNIFIMQNSQNTIWGRGKNMENLLFHVFSDDRFMDLTLYQYGYEKCVPLHSYGPAIRNHYLFHYVISGKGTLSVDKSAYSEKYDIHGGMGFLIEPDHITTYSADRNDPWEYAWIEFDGLKAKEILDGAGLSTDSPVYIPKSEQAGNLLKSELLHLASCKMKSSYHLIGHLFLIMDALLSGSSSKRKTQNGKRTQFYTNEAITFISSNYALPITVEDMANRLNLDRSYFGKIFKETMGQSPQEFLIRYRMSKAAELLKTTDLSIKDISLKVGYPNQLHFSRAFKNVYNQSPRTYRQNTKIIKS